MMRPEACLVTPVRECRRRQLRHQRKAQYPISGSAPMKGLVSTPDHGARTAGAGPGTVALNSRTTGRSRLRRTLPAGESVSSSPRRHRVRYGSADERPCAEASGRGPAAPDQPAAWNREAMVSGRPLPARRAWGPHSCPGRRPAADLLSAVLHGSLAGVLEALTQSARAPRGRPGPAGVSRVAPVSRWRSCGRPVPRTPASPAGRWPPTPRNRRLHGGCSECESGSWYWMITSCGTW